MDVLLYSFALTAVRAEFQLSSAAAGALAAVPLVTSAVGGALIGYLADRFGRARALSWSILTFSLATALTATAHGVPELILWRAFVGIGLGGEWAAGSVLVAETWPAKHRSKGIGLMQSGWAIGYLLAAVLAALGAAAIRLARAVPGGDSARAVHTGGSAATSASRRVWTKCERMPITALLRPPLGRRVFLFTTLAASVLFGYWGLFTWLPAYLSTPVAQGGAGMSIVRSSAWLIPPCSSARSSDTSRSASSPDAWGSGRRS